MSTLFKEKIDQMRWSYSRINSYDQCPKMFYLTYIDKDKSKELDSAFSQWGDLCHELLDEYAKGNLMECELGDAYEEKYPEFMTELFPPNKWSDLNETYYLNGKDYFNDFDGFPENWEIIGSEIEVELCIDGFQVVGYIDLLVRDKSDGKLIVVDHKSKSKFKNPEEQEHYSYQLYFYSQWVFENYGEYPKQLIFNMFRARKFVIIPFSNNNLEKAKQWLLKNIGKIYEDEDFKDKVEISYLLKNKEIPEYLQPDFFCSQLCSVRYRCNRSGLCIDE